MVVSFQSVAEEAVSRARYDCGNVRDLAALFTPDKLAVLREQVGVCCFLAFHARGDREIAGYVRSGTIADDSGPDILVLFALDEPAPIAVPLGGGSFERWGEAQRSVHPAYRLVRMLFDGAAPPLPGLVVFGDIAADTDAVYLPLGHLADEQEVRTHLRQVFADIAHAHAAARSGRFLDDLGVAWTRRGLAYERTDRRPMREWLIEGFRVVRENYGDIVTTLGLL